MHVVIAILRLPFFGRGQRPGGVIRSVRSAGTVLCSASLVALGAGLLACSPAPLASVVEPVLEVPRLRAGGTPTPEGGIRFGRAAPAIGSRWSVAVSAASSFDFFDGNVSVRELSEYVSTYTVEVLAVSGSAPTRLRVAFGRNAQRYQETYKPTAIDGKTYVVDVTAPHVRDASDAVPSPEETERVLDTFPDLGTRTQIDQILPDVAMVPGQERHELATAVLRILHPRAWTLNRGTAVLARADAGEATFDVTLDATSRVGLRMTVKGEVKIRLRDARLTAIMLEGNYEQPPDSPTSPPGVLSPPGALTVRRVVRDL